jgi:hypothetical protein
MKRDSRFREIVIDSMYLGQFDGVFARLLADGSDDDYHREATLFLVTIAGAAIPLELASMYLVKL